MNNCIALQYKWFTKETLIRTAISVVALRLYRFKLLTFIILFIIPFLSVFEQASLAQAATLSISPSSSSVSVGGTFTVDIVIDTGGANTDGIDIHYLRFDPTLLEVQQVQSGTLYPSTQTNTFDNTAGTINFSKVTTGSTIFTGSGTLATITFLAKSSGTASISFDFTPGNTTDTNIASAGTDILTSATGGSYTLTTTTSALPDLIPYTPTGWSSPLILRTVGCSLNSCSPSSSFDYTDIIYVNLGVLNDSSVDVTSTFLAKVYVDGIEKRSWTFDPLQGGYWYAYWNWSIGTFAPGQHTIKLSIDTPNSVSESNEGNNEYNSTFTVNSTTGSASGSVRVSIVPQEAADAGAQWKLTTESTWHNSGTIKNNVTFGTYQVEFKTTAGWITPPNKQVTISVVNPNIWVNGDPYTQNTISTPTNLQAIATSSNEITLTWEDNSSNEEAFILEWDIGATGSYSRRYVLGPNTTSWIDDGYIWLPNYGGLKPGTTYCYRIQTFASALGYSGFSNETCATTLNADTTGPVPTIPIPSKNPITEGVNTSITISATIDDTSTGNSDIAAAEYYIGSSNHISMSPTDGAFNSTNENVQANIDTSTWTAANSPYTINVRGQDAEGNWGNTQSVSITVNSYQPVNRDVCPSGCQYSTIQQAIDDALSGDTIRVAQGTYYENISVTNTFKNFTLEGGWDTNFVTRSNDPSLTIIDGGGNGTCITLQNVNGNVIIDGFKIQSGNAIKGGGINSLSSQPKITNCIFSGNYADDGGGIYNEYSSLTISNSDFYDNIGGNGGGIHNINSSPIIIGCVFNRNKGGTGSGGNGGGVYNEYSSPIITNCIFYENSADHFGGAILNYYYSSPTIKNCTFSRNSAGQLTAGGAIDNNIFSSPIIFNSILWGNIAQNFPEIKNINSSNPVITYSDIDQDGYAGNNGNIRQDPLFLDSTNGDYHLQHSSPCIDTGINTGAPLTDFEGDVRPYDGDNDGTATVDIGADEYADSDDDGYTENQGDCNDNDATVYPDAPELCDSKDNNCNDIVDDILNTYWVDGDGDGYGDAAFPVDLIACETPVGYSDNSDDCNDSCAECFPGAAVTDLSARAKSGRSGSKIQLTWSHVCAVSYNVYRSVAGGDYEYIGDTTSTYSTYQDALVTNGTEYCYKVKGVDVLGVETADSNPACATPTERIIRRR